MLTNNSFYKGNNILNDNNREQIKNYFNPYEYNFESNLKDQENMDIVKGKSNCHYERKISKNKNK